MCVKKFELKKILQKTPIAVTLSSHDETSVKHYSDESLPLKPGIGGPASTSTPLSCVNAAETAVLEGQP